MAISFSPTVQDVDRYRHFRALSTKLNSRLIKTIPKQALDEIGEALGILRDGILVFRTEDMTNVLMDCCLYDWYHDGRNLIERYVEAHPAEPGTDEHYLYEACLDAEYRVLVPQSVVPGAGIHCEDVLNREKLFLMDIAFSRSVEPYAAALAARTIPLEDFWMSTGAALPIDPETDIQAALDHIGRQEWIDDRATMPLSIVRAGLAAGAAGHIKYAGSERAGKKPRREPRFPGFKRHRK